MNYTEDFLIVEDHIIPEGIVLAVLAPFLLILNLPPLIWHIRNRNTAAISMVFWIMLINLISVINVIIWPYIDMRDMYDGQGLCDVEIKLIIGRTVGLNAAIVCLLRALAAVLNTEKTLLGPTKAQKRRNLLIELGWCAGLPLLAMIFQYIVQLNRFALVGVTGCRPFYSGDWTGFLLTWMLPLLTNTVAVYYAILVIIRLRRYRSSFHSILASNNSTRGRFLRLFSIACILIMIVTPIQIYVVVTQLPRRADFRSFSAIHNPETWNSSFVVPSSVLLDRWLNLGCGFLIFFFFGLGKDAKEMYREWLLKAGLGGCFPWLLAHRESSSRGPASTSSSSRTPLRKGSSWVKTESSQRTSSMFSTPPRKARCSDTEISAMPAPPTRPLTAFIRRFDPRRRVEQPGTKFELPIFQHRRQKSNGEDDQGVLVSKEVKRESYAV